MKNFYNSINDANLKFILLNRNYCNFRSNDVMMSNDPKINKK